MSYSRFNTQPPEGGWDVKLVKVGAPDAVSTHSRLKAAGNGYDDIQSLR